MASRKRHASGFERSVVRKVTHIKYDRAFSREVRTYRRPRTRTIAVTVPYPVSRPLVRTVNYTYPLQRQLVKRTIRVPLVAKVIAHGSKSRPAVTPGWTGYRMRRIKIQVPAHLPLVKGSYVSTELDRRGQPRLSIHSARRLERLMHRENNRRRYQENKSNHRKYRNGQLDSVRGDKLGMIAHAVLRGYSPRVIADTAMVSRALGAS